MDKRFVTFLMLTMLMFVGYLQLKLWLNPPPDPPAAARNDEGEGDVDGGGRGARDEGRGDEPGDSREPDGVDDGSPPDDPSPDEPPPDEPPESEDTTTAAALRKIRVQQWVTLGSVDPADGYRMLLTFNNKGAALERAELSSDEYLDLEDATGYFGHLALTNADDGAVVNAVGRGTPASRAKCATSGVSDGLQVGDVIVAVNDQPIESDSDANFVTAAHHALHAGAPGEDVTVTVRRGEGASAQKLKFTATLRQAHLQVIQPNRLAYAQKNTPLQAPNLQPFSFLTRLMGIGIDMREVHWEVLEDKAKGDEVAFRVTIDANDLKDEPGAQPLEVIKRFRLAKVDPENKDASPAYHVTMNIEVRNVGKQSTKIALEQRGPTGLPLEGWWYVRKGSPHWGSAGARDVVWRSVDEPSQLIRLPVIYDYDEAIAEGEDKPTRNTPVFNLEGEPVMRYVGVDTQYFAAVMLPDVDAPNYKPDAYQFKSGRGITVGERHKKWKATTGVSFWLMTDDESIKPGESFEQQYTVFIGPKDEKILDPYGLQETIVYGWHFFGVISGILLKVLDVIKSVVRNYGIAIILLTVLVRLLVLPIGRKQAQNAAKMQELAPELKAIADKYKDMEQKAKAQKELFHKHNYHPLGGCWMMFLQLPIFFGLYKALNTSIHLRQAPFIPGVEWCSNLAGPDMLFRWDSFMPAFLAAENGFLGPYFNILPLITIGLFILQQKMFMPPAADEQQKMQQNMMKYMMIFMGFMFFKVPSGLCLYFIVSALWSVAERKLLPKPKPKGGPVVAKDKDDAPAKKDKPTPRPKTKAELKENSLAALFNSMLNKTQDTNGKDGPEKKRPKRKKKRK